MDWSVGEGTEPYVEVLDHVRSKTQWRPDPQFPSPAEQVAAVREDRTSLGEIYFTRPETDARIRMEFPASTTGDAVELLLDNPLDRHLKESDGDGFGRKVARAHASIVSAHQSGYLEPVGGLSLLARVRIPVELDGQTLDESLHALDAIAVETERLHREITAPLERYIENG